MNNIKSLFKGQNPQDILLSWGAFALPMLYFQGFTQAFFEPKWIFVYWLLILFPLLGLKSLKQLHFVKLPLYVRVTLLVMLLSFIFNLWQAHGSFITQASVDRLVFVSGLYFLFPCMSRWQRPPRLLLTSLLISVFLTSLWGFWQAYEHEIIFILAKNKGVGPAAFGNVNMAAQFIGSTLFLSFLAHKFSPSKKLKALLWIQVFFALAYLVFSLNRSVYLGLALGFTYYFYQVFKERVPLVKLAAKISIALGALTLMVTLGLYLSGNQQILQGQDASTNQRLIMHKTALMMALDHPFGVGVGLYKFESLPYARNLGRTLNESQIDVSPHNEYLRFWSEEGLVYFVGALILLFFLLNLQPRDKVEVPWIRESWWLAKATLLYFMVEAYFQFPLENPWPFFYSLLLISFLLVHSNLSQIQSNKWPVGLLILPLFLFAFMQSYSWYAGSFLRDDKEALARTCKWMPTNWSNCLSYAQLLGKNKEYDESNKVLEKLLLQSKHNHFALKIWAINHMRMREPQRGCKALAVVEQYFLGDTSTHHIFVKFCDPEIYSEYRNENLFESYQFSGLSALTY